MTPAEGLPDWAHLRMQGDAGYPATPRHFTAMAQTLLYGGAKVEVVWPPFTVLAAIGGVLFVLLLARFRRMLASLG